MTFNSSDGKYTKTSYESLITENELVYLLLVYLKQRGVTRIHEDELAKKLFLYFCDDKYCSLFRGIHKDPHDFKVDISRGLYTEKNYSTGIMWDTSRPKRLYLNYNQSSDIPTYEDQIGPKIINLLKSIADDFSIRNKIENSKLNVYGENPNKHYVLISAKKINRFESEIITDGKIDKSR
jgi:hypothetical protein